MSSPPLKHSVLSRLMHSSPLEARCVALSSPPRGTAVWLFWCSNLSCPPSSLVRCSPCSSLLCPVFLLLCSSAQLASRLLESFPSEQQRGSPRPGLRPGWVALRSVATFRPDSVVALRSVATLERLRNAVQPPGPRTHGKCPDHPRLLCHRPPQRAVVAVGDRVQPRHHVPDRAVVDRQRGVRLRSQQQLGQQVHGGQNSLFAVLCCNTVDRTFHSIATKRRRDRLRGEGRVVSSPRPASPARPDRSARRRPPPRPR